jgi:Transcription factor WhiB
VDTSYLRAGARGVTDRTATGLEGSWMEHDDAGIRTPPGGLRTREEEHDLTSVDHPTSALSSRPSALGMTRPPAPRAPLDAPAPVVARASEAAGQLTADVYDLMRHGSAKTAAFATARRNEPAENVLGVVQPASTRTTDAEDLVDDSDDLADDSDDELGAGLNGDLTTDGDPNRPVLAEVIDIGLGDLLGEVMEWQERALCAQTDPEAFFPEKGGSTREAKRICSGCEVRDECLEYALANDERFGIWGGMSERERRKQRRRAV